MHRPCSHGCEAQSLTLISHISPVKPGKHRQVKPNGLIARFVKQVPLFAHVVGFKHGSTNCSHVKPACQGGHKHMKLS